MEHVNLENIISAINTSIPLASLSGLPQDILREASDSGITRTPILMKRSNSQIVFYRQFENYFMYIFLEETNQKFYFQINLITYLGFSFHHFSRSKQMIFVDFRPPPALELPFGDIPLRPLVWETGTWTIDLIESLIANIPAEYIFEGEYISQYKYYSSSANISLRISIGSSMVLYWTIKEKFMFGLLNRRGDLNIEICLGSEEVWCHFDRCAKEQSHGRRMDSIFLSPEKVENVSAKRILKFWEKLGNTLKKI